MKKIIEDKLTTLIFNASILIFIIAFNFAHNPPGGWYQQFMPDLGGRQISDIFFLDSLTGWAVTPFTKQNDSVFVTKTTNGGDNWFISFMGTGQWVGLNRIYFLNQYTGFACGEGIENGIHGLVKTTNGGINWFNLYSPSSLSTFDNFSVESENLIWLVSDLPLEGGLFKTTNGGQNWERQFGGISGNPDKVYFYDANLGFINNGVGNNILRRTTNGGMTWTEIPGVGGFTDIEFIDENTGWKALAETERIRKTTNGGLNWFEQYLPPKSNFILISRIRNLSLINKDTLWGSYPLGYLGGYKGLLYLSTNGGETWGYQIPDTTFYSTTHSYFFNSFLNKSIGWAYYLRNNGVHTKTGGDTTIILDIKQLNNTIPADFNLYQNYPNPFNPVTNIRFDIAKTSNVMLIINDILGKEVIVLKNEKLSSGSYEYTFDAGVYTSGVYFYSLIVEGKVVDTKRMMLLK